MTCPPRNGKLATMTCKRFGRRPATWLSSATFWMGPRCGRVYGMAADEDFRKHLDLVQGVVNRLVGNSFSVKTWAVGLITILGALTAKDGDPRMAIALLFPALCFWGLDAYYLRQERLFRELYKIGR